MPYLIYARDFEEMDAQREQIRDAHREHLRSIGDKLLASGALLDEDGITVIGGISLTMIPMQKLAYVRKH